MLDKLKERRQELKVELATGTQRLLELENTVRGLRETLGRISGAIEVLDEMIAENEADPEGMR